MPNRLESCPLVSGRQHQALEPRHQIKGNLAYEQVGPVGMELLSRELLQAKATLMFLNGVFHIGMPQVPDHQRRSRLDVVLSHYAIILPISFPASPLLPLPFPPL